MLFDSGIARRREIYAKSLKLARKLNELSSDPLEQVSILETVLTAQSLFMAQYGATGDPPDQ